MIDRIQSRLRDRLDVDPEPTLIRESAEKNLEYFILYEISYGGYIKKIEVDDVDTIVVIVTQAMGCEDTTIFRGPNEEMKDILLVATLAATNHGFLCEASREAALAEVVKVSEGNPRLLSFGIGELVIGQFSVRNICLALLGVSEPKYLDHFQTVKLKDLVAALLLFLNKEITLDEAVELTPPQSNQWPTSPYLTF